MATRLTKPVRRDAGDIGLRGGDAGDYIVSLYPGGLLGLRRKRCKKELHIGLGACYRLACEVAAEFERAKGRKRH